MVDSRAGAADTQDKNGVYQKKKKKNGCIIVPKNKEVPRKQRNRRAWGLSKRQRAKKKAWGQ